MEPRQTRLQSAPEHQLKALFLTVEGGDLDADDLLRRACPRAEPNHHISPAC
ncbi:MAG: hypothetical protein J5I81_00475 [Nitrococcus mobilis]|nr:hypothetical protein [Nitrococcus mobilis]